MQQDVGVGHAGDVVGYDAGKAFAGDFGEVAFGQVGGRFHPEFEERGDDLFGLVVLDGELRTGVEVVVEILLFLQALGLDPG